MLVFNFLSDSSVSIKKLIYFAESKGLTDQILKEYIVRALLADDNALSMVAENGVEPGASLRAAALKDLDKLWRTFANDPVAGYVPSLRRKAPFYEYGQSIKNIVMSLNSEEMLNKLISHYKTFGGGKSAGYIAFKWLDGLQGIDKPDVISLKELYCVDAQKNELVKNTRAFLDGMPYHNALLYGERGSGKSSMVKALLNEFYNDGLRMAEISKNKLEDMPKLIDAVKIKNFHFIVFLDDLSFEQNDAGYKNLKVILEGQTERQPQNIVFYATSNRRHLVNETWSERDGDDIHRKDTINEKLSLSERFGINLYFPSPDKHEYIEIVEGILAERGAAITDELKAEAIKFAASRSGRTGRIAAQFAKTALLRPVL